ncbi:PE-PGRS family protein [Streptomyces sp. NPDC029003]|uniref:PE-PGRS family protein n=1 Tax=Streptomyces sp. NPDC029003 TaxID=3155125 RepID=UPI0033D4EAB2
MVDASDDRLRDQEGYEALLAAMGLEPVGTWWLPGVRKAATARRLLAAAAAEREPATGPAAGHASGHAAVHACGPPAGHACGPAAGHASAASPEAAAGLVLAGGREFLLAFEGPHSPRGCRGRAWHRVRIPAADPVPALAALFRAADPDPRGLLVATTDGETVARVDPGPGAPGLLVLTGTSARIEAAARAGARESDEEGAAVWDGFLTSLSAAGPDARLRGAWAEGLVSNPAAPEPVRRALALAEPSLMWLLPPDALVEAVLAQPDPKARIQAVERMPSLGSDDWDRLFRAAATERERWLLATVASDGGAVLGERTCALLAADPSARVRTEAARLAALAVHHRVALTEDPDPGVRATACRRAWPALPPERRRALLTDEAPSVRARARLAQYEEVPLSLADFAGEEPDGEAVETCLLGPDLVEHLLATGDARLRRALATNPRLDPRTVARLAEDPDDGVRYAVALRADLTEEQRAAIRVDVDPSLRSYALPWVVERHEDPEAMRVLAASSHPLVRRSVARARRLPPDVAERLAWDPDRAVQLFLAESCDDAPAEMLLRVWTWWTGSLSSPGRPRTHPNFPREGLLRYADDPHGRMRQLALDDPESCAALVARFARDRDPEVRRRAAEDPRLPVAEAALLAEDPSDGVRATVLRSRRLPARLLADRLRAPDTATTAARNPGLPAHVIEALALHLTGGPG